MESKVSSFEEKVKLPAAETISRFYQPQRNRKAIRILTVAVYVLCVSLAAIMLSLYYIFIWDPTIKTFVPGKGTSNCEKIVIPERIAIRLTNSTDITVDQFYQNILKYYQLKLKSEIKRKLSSAAIANVQSRKLSEDDEDYVENIENLESSGHYYGD